MAQKFIVKECEHNPGQMDLVMGQVDYHKELCKDHSRIRGGGWWYVDEKQKIVYLYNESIDFGQARREAVIDALTNGLHSLSLQDYTYIHSYQYNLNHCLEDKDAVTIIIPEENKF